MAFRAIVYFYVEEAIKDVNLTSGKFIDFTLIAFWSYLLDSITGCCAFLAWIKIFKYVSFNKAMTQLSGTLNKGATQLIKLGNILQNDCSGLLTIFRAELPEISKVCG